jgi:hypothetical protein
MPSYKPVQKILVVDGASFVISPTANYETYYVYGTASTTTSWAVTMSGTALEGMRVKFEYRATITLESGTVLTFLGTQMPSDYIAKKVNIDCYYNGTVWVVDYQPAFDETNIILTTHIKDANITTAKILDANVTLAKIEALTSGQIIVGNSSNRPTAVAVTGPIAITNAGVTSIVDDSIVNADINASAAIATSKLAASADIAKIANVTQAELEFLHDVTAGTAAASKALVLSAASKITGIAELDSTVLKIAGTAIASTATELNQLNGQSVVAADFALIAGAAAAGVTVANVQGIATDAAAKVQVKTASYNSDQTVDNATGLICLTLLVDTVFTLPDGAGNTKQVIDIIIVDNLANAYDISFADTGSNFYYASATPSSDSIKISAPPPGTIIKIVNSAANIWVIGVS